MCTFNFCIIESSLKLVVYFKTHNFCDKIVKFLNRFYCHLVIPIESFIFTKILFCLSFHFLPFVRLVENIFFSTVNVQKQPFYVEIKRL